MARVSIDQYGNMDDAQRQGINEIEYAGGQLGRKTDQGWQYDFRPEAFGDALGQHELGQQGTLANLRASGARVDQEDSKALAGAGGGGSSNPTVQQWAQAGQQQQQAADPRSDELFNMLRDRAQQGLGVSRNDPAVRSQADAYAAQEERARRGYLGDIAEQAGPFASGALQNERRLSAERMGQRVGGFEAQLIGRELQSRRDEIAQALSQMQGMLSGDQQAALTRELAMLDQQIKQQGLNLQGKSLDQDWQRALMGNDQFLRQLGLSEWDIANKWDTVRSGAYGG